MSDYYDGSSVKEQIKNLFIFTPVCLGEFFLNIFTIFFFFFGGGGIKNFEFSLPFFREEKKNNFLDFF